MFDNKKVLQIISYLLSLNGNKMDKLKLMKELYLIDRMSIPAESNRKIKFSDIMKALGKSDEEIISAKNKYDNLTDLYTSIGLK